MEKLGDQVPETINFNIGYFEGRQSKKRWLCCQDLNAMYQATMRVGRFLCGAIPGTLVVNSLKLVYARPSYPNPKTGEGGTGGQCLS